MNVSRYCVSRCLIIIKTLVPLVRINKSLFYPSIIRRPKFTKQDHFWNVTLLYVRSLQIYCQPQSSNLIRFCSGLHIIMWWRYNLTLSDKLTWSMVRLVRDLSTNFRNDNSKVSCTCWEKFSLELLFVFNNRNIVRVTISK